MFALCRQRTACPAALDYGTMEESTRSIAYRLERIPVRIILRDEGRGSRGDG